jgi:DNA-binding transcriptional MocR family regulator
MKAQNKFSAGGNNRLMDDAMSINPFSQDMLGSDTIDGKAPYRTVIKRYWTEDEVII